MTGPPRVLPRVGHRAFHQWMRTVLRECEQIGGGDDDRQSRLWPPLRRRPLHAPRGRGAGPSALMQCQTEPAQSSSLSSSPSSSSSVRNAVEVGNGGQNGVLKKRPLLFLRPLLFMQREDFRIWSTRISSRIRKRSP